MSRALVVWGLLLAAGAIAQSTPAPESAPSVPPPPAGPAEATPPALPGDTIHFRAGGMLSGVQVLRETLDAFEVEVQEGVDPIVIPRSQVQRIEYDDRDVLRERRHQRRLSQGAAEGDIVQGQEVAVELYGKLTTALPAEPITYEDKDFIEVLNDLAQRFQFKLEISDAVKQIPAEERTISLETRPGSTLVNVLRTGVLERFPSLELAYKFDTVVIRTREAGEINGTPPPVVPAEAEPVAPVAEENSTAGQEAGGDDGY